MRGPRVSGGHPRQLLRTLLRQGDGLTQFGRVSRAYQKARGSLCCSERSDGPTPRRAVHVEKVQDVPEGGKQMQRGCLERGEQERISSTGEWSQTIPFRTLQRSHPSYQ